MGNGVCEAVVIVQVGVPSDGNPQNHSHWRLFTIVLSVKSTIAKTRH